jgi:hypothetical protein
MIWHRNTHSDAPAWGAVPLSAATHAPDTETNGKIKAKRLTRRVGEIIGILQGRSCSSRLSADVSDESGISHVLTFDSSRPVNKIGKEMAPP